MIIVIEGNRGVGKTTLIRDFTRLMRFWRFFNGKVPEVVIEKWERGENPHEDMLRQINEMQQDNLVHVVDRFHITEFALRTNELLSSDHLMVASATAMKLYELERELREIDQKLHESENATVVVLTTGWKTIERRLAKRKDKARREVSRFVHYTFGVVANKMEIPLFRNDGFIDAMTTILALMKVAYIRSQVTK